MQVFAKIRKQEAQVTLEKIKETQDKLDKGLDYLESLLKDHKHIVNDEITLADLVAVSDISQMQFMKDFEDYIKKRERLNQWF